MMNGKIKESDITASSYKTLSENRTGAALNFARLNISGYFTVGDGYPVLDRKQYLQVDLRKIMTVEMVSMFTMTDLTPMMRLITSIKVSNIVPTVLLKNHCKTLRLTYLYYKKIFRQSHTIFNNVQHD